MKIGILVLFVNSFGQRGLYNSQEIGMAKEMSKRGHEVKIYKCVSASETRSEEMLFGKIIYHLEPVKTLGNNAITDFSWIDTVLDTLVCFSDIQLYTRRLYKWAKGHNIVFIPYVGITHSTSPSMLRRVFINLCARSAYGTYKKTGVLSKTNAIKKELDEKGVKDIQVAPVGLDFDLLHQDYKAPRDWLLKELKLQSGRKYILMVGRIANDRNPLDVVHVFKRLHEADGNYRLIVIGKGPLKEELSGKLAKCGLSNFIFWIEQVPNSEMWKYYRVSTCLVSFSRTEIFGMSILEAMYYELPVFVIHAPGPNDIIVDKEAGYLFSSPEEMAKALLKGHDVAIEKKEHQRIIEHFSWSHMVDLVEQRARNKY